MAMIIIILTIHTILDNLMWLPHKRSRHTHHWVTRSPCTSWTTSCDYHTRLSTHTPLGDPHSPCTSWTTSCDYHTSALDTHTTGWPAQPVYLLDNLMWLPHKALDTHTTGWPAQPVYLLDNIMWLPHKRSRHTHHWVTRTARVPPGQPHVTTTQGSRHTHHWVTRRPCSLTHRVRVTRYKEIFLFWNSDMLFSTPTPTSSLLLSL